MRLMQILFGKGAAPSRPVPPSLAASPPSSLPSSSFGPAGKQGLQMRRDLLKVALQEALQRHGIPQHWIAATTLTAASDGKITGLHWRLAVKHWDARFPVHMVALQNALLMRIHRVDPMAQQWLMGVSWEFALDDDPQFPDMPHPGSWTAPPREVTPHPVHALELGQGDVIEGPAGVGASSADVRARLEGLMAPLDAAYGAKPGAATQPMFLKTEPANLDAPRGERPI